MRRILLASVLLLPLFAFHGAPAEAGPIDRVEQKVDYLVERLREIRNTLRSVFDRTASLPDLASTMMQARTDAAGGTPVRDFLDATRRDMRKFAEQERDRFLGFVNSDEPERLKGKLRSFVLDLRDLTNAQLELMFSLDVPCVGTLKPQPVTFERLLEAIDRIPSAALYPLYLAKELLDELDGQLPPLLRCLTNHLIDSLSVLADLLREDTPPRELVADVERMTTIRAIRSLLRVVAWVMEKAGAQIVTASKSMDFSYEVALWGWVGFTINPGTIESLGTKLQSGARSLRTLADRINVRLHHAELMAASQTLAENQQIILDRLNALSAPATQVR